MFKRKLISILLVIILAIGMAGPLSAMLRFLKVRTCRIIIAVLILAICMIPVYSIPVYASTLTLFPNGAGYASDCTKSAGTYNYQNVDEDPADTADYNYTTSTSQKYDSFAFPDHTSESDTITSVTVYAYVKASSYFQGKAGVFVRLGTTNVTSGQSFSSDAWAYKSAALARPGGGSWTWTDIDNLEAGYYLSAVNTYTEYSAQCYVVVTHIPITAPTITLSAASSVEATTATLNGGVTDTGGDNPTVTVYWGTTDHPGTATGWDHNSAPTSPSQPQGVATFYYNATSLSTGTTFYFTAKATNVAGTSWPAASLSFLTKPAAPTNVSATDGTYTNKVTITWTQSVGATNNIVLRGGINVSGTLGAVGTWDDTGVGGPTITPGTASATDGTNSANVTLSLSGNSVSDGPTVTYTIIASNATGPSSASSGDTGYCGHGSLTYQWQVSASDYDGNYSNITGGTTSPYTYTSAPVNGTGLYFKCVESSSGASNEISTSDRGFIGVPSGSSGGLGLVIIGRMDSGAVYTTGLDAFTVSNDGNCPIDVSVSGTDMTGGDTWTLSDTATPDANTFGVKAGLNGADYTTIVKKTAPYNLIGSNVGVGDSVVFGVKFYAPTSISDGVTKKGTLSCNIVIH